MRNKFKPFSGLGGGLFCLFIALFTFLIAPPLFADHGPEVRVGVYPMPPLTFVDEEGDSQGLYPDLLREIARDEGWQLVFVPGSWSECYDRLLKGEIDLLAPVAYSPERANIFDFNKESVADIWGRVYTRTGTNISDLRDLTDKPVAIVRKGINGINFIKTAKKFDVQPVIIEVKSRDEVFLAIQRGDVVAGVVPQTFGFREAKKYGMVPTTIEFEPFSVFFAVKAGTNSDLLQHIDNDLADWKKIPDSIYFERVAYWMGGQREREVVPKWLYIAFFVVIGGAAFLVFVSLSLKHQVRVRTEEIARREARFRKLSETTKAVPWELDIATSTFSYLGPQIVDMFGYPMEEWTDMESWVAKVLPEDRDRTVNFCTLETAKGKDHDFVFRGVHRDGRTLWIHDIVTVSMGVNGPEKLYGYFVDITEIREQEERFRKMFRDHNAVMLLVDPQTGAIVDANDAACVYYGYSKEQLIALPMGKICTSPTHEIVEVMQARKENRQNYFECKHRLASGEARDIESYSSPIKINNQIMLFSIVHDITERKKLLEEHGRTEQLAALGTVAAGVAHEINNPIQGIMNYATLLQNAPDNKERVLDIAQRISRESDRIAKITRDLLFYSKDSRNEMKLANIKELVESALSLMATKIRQSGIIIETDIASDLPRISVNPQGVQQIVINLLDNASYALRDKEIPTEEKAIRIRGYVVDVNGQPNFCLEVCDNGIGMSEEVVKKARNAFFSTKPSAEGTGLGLSIVNEIVLKHKGQFEIESQAGEYSKIQIFLPITAEVDVS